MIRVELVDGKGPNYRWRAAWHGGVLEGRSATPLLDACRAAKRMGAAPVELCGLFWPGHEDWALRTTVGHGSGIAVYENQRRIYSAKYQPHPRSGSEDG